MERSNIQSETTLNTTTLDATQTTLKDWELLDANHKSDSSTSNKEEKPLEFEKYTVKEDDSLVKVAYKFDMSVSKLHHINDIVGDHIYPG